MSNHAKRGVTEGVVRSLILWVALVVTGAAILIGIANPQLWADIAPPAVMIGSGVAGVLIFRGASHHPDRERLSWRLVGVGLMMASAGVAVVGAIDVIVGSVPSFGPHDLVFLSAYCVAVAGFAIMPQLGGVFRSRLRVLLDGLIGAVSMATLVWILFLPSLQTHLTSATSWERFAGIAYPVLDSTMVVVAMIVTIRRSTWRFDPRIVLFGLGMVLQALGDLSFLSTGVGQQFSEAHPNFLPFLLAVGLYLCTAANIKRRPRPREYADRRQPLWSMLAPYGAALVVLGLISVELSSVLSGRTAALLVIGLAVTSLVLARQAVALREYRSLVGQQRRALVASVSHELRTPLTAMVGFLALLKEPGTELEPGERLELTDVVHQQAVYMSRIVSDLLLLAGNSNRLVLEEAEVKVDTLIEETLLAVRPRSGKIETEIKAGMVARLDPDRIRQAVANLVVNALRYGRDVVRVKAFADQSDLVIEVHDNGDGVPRKYELVIWEQFERGPNRLNAAVPGSGIGLAVVDLVVRKHGGAAVYERSKLLGGACFRLILRGRIVTVAPAASEPELTSVAH